MRKIMALLVLVLLLSPGISGLAYSERTPPYDCGFLLAMFYDVLVSIVDKEPNTQLIKLLMNATVPEGIRDTHVKLYRMLYDIAVVEEEVSRYSQHGEPLPRSLYIPLMTKLYRAISGVMDLVEGYTDALAGCTFDKTMATIMGIQVRLLYPKLAPTLYELEQSILSLAYGGGPGIADVELVARSVNASNPVLVVCSHDQRAARLEAVVFLGHSPANTLFETASLEPGAGGARCARIRLDLSGVKPPRFFVFTRSEKVPAWMIAKLLDEDGRVLAAPRLLRFSIVYWNPLEEVSIPDEVAYGENITVKLAARVPVNVTLRVDGHMARASINGSGEVSVPSTGLTIGYHTLILQVEPLEERSLYTPLSYSKAIAVVAAPPKVDIIVDNPSITVWNTVKMRVVNRAEEPVRVKLRFGFTSIDTIVYDNDTFTLFAPLNPLPWLYRFNVTVSGLNTTATASYQVSVLLINPLGILAVMLVAVGIALYHDRIDILRLVAARPPRTPAPRKAEEAAGGEAYYEALRIRVRRSRLARLYYSLLQRLGIPLPRPPQTLREHWVEEVRSFDEKGELWEKMLSAERDLYGPKNG